MRKTLSLDEPLRTVLAPFAKQITWAFIYGSIAKGEAHSSSDIDLMLIGESLNYSEVMEQLMPLEEQLGRTLNPTLYTPKTGSANGMPGTVLCSRSCSRTRSILWGATPGFHGWTTR